MNPLNVLAPWLRCGLSQTELNAIHNAASQTHFDAQGQELIAYTAVLHNTKYANHLIDVFFSNSTPHTR